MPKKRNKPGTRSIERRFFILCEGKKDKSEYSYYKNLIADMDIPSIKADVKLVPTKKNTGRELVREAISLKEIDSDIAWVAYDKDGYTKHPETFLLANQKNIKIAFSAICFEYWILLHFEYTSKPFSCCDDLLAYIKKTFNIECEKYCTNIYSLIKDKTEFAIINAKKLVIDQIRSNPQDTHIYEMNPYTNIYELIEELKQFQ